jgi:Fe-S-cluster containining protein
MSDDFRPCGDCTACCDGWLIGEAKGHPFGNCKACYFLINKLCTIYNDRPQVCRNYQCAWTQHLLPDWMKPNKCGVLVSVETKEDHQFLRVIEMRPAIDYAIYYEIDKFCKESNTYCVKVPYEDRYT